MDAMETGDFELMRLARAGRREAVASLVRRHQRTLLGFFLRLGADPAGAEACVPAPCIRLYRSLDRYTPASPFRSFLCTIARHVIADWFRRWKKDAAAASAEGLEEIPSEASPEAFDVHLDLRSSLARLSD